MCERERKREGEGDKRNRMREEERGEDMKKEPSVGNNQLHGRA